jgi:hypothetical protein
VNIKRYQINSQSPTGYTENPVGPWMAASEALARIAELEAENARLRAELAALTPPQPVADWRERCVVEKCEDGLFDVVSPCGRFWLSCLGDEWMAFDHFTMRGCFGSFENGPDHARQALAACPTPPPGVGK